MAKRQGEPFVGPPSKQHAGERADSHAAVSELIEDTSSRSRDDTMETSRSSNPKKDFKQFQTMKPASDNLLRSYTSHLTGPKPAHVDIPITVPVMVLDEIAKTVRNSILNVLYPDGDYLPDGVCSEDDWLTVIRYIFKSRIDLVYSSYTGRRPADRIPPVRILMPRSLAMLINGVGCASILHGNCTVYPAPEPPPVDSNQRIGSLATFDRLTRFSNLITAALQRGVIHAETIATTPEGTAWWLLRASDTLNRSNLATILSQSVTIWAQFDDWTPSDGLLAALAVTQLPGYVLDDWTNFSYMLDSITDIRGIRVDFATNA